MLNLKLLLSLIRNLDLLPRIAQRDICHLLLCTDRASIGFILDERNSFPSWDQSDFSESFKPAEKSSKTIYIVVLWNVLYE
jgi:hypothetical protein